MISKKVISDIVSKYSLGNNIEKVKWVITDEKLIINFINDSKNLVGYIDYRKAVDLLKNTNRKEGINRIIRLNTRIHIIFI